jgi:ankyrin repeat protein
LSAVRMQVSFDIVELLLNHGAHASVNAKDDVGYTALHLAASKGMLRVVEALLNRGADINAPTKGGDTALMLAAPMDHLGVVKLLLERGADTGVRNEKGKTAKDLAQARDHDRITRLLETVSGSSVGFGTGTSARLTGRGDVAIGQGVAALRCSRVWGRGPSEGNP